MYNSLCEFIFICEINLVTEKDIFIVPWFVGKTLLYRVILEDVILVV